MKIENNYVNGQWFETDKTIKVYKNNNSDIQIGEFSILGKDDLDYVVESANNAFPEWSGITLEERISYIDRFATILEEKADKLAIIVGDEVAKSYAGSKTEILRTVDYIRYTIKEARAFEFETTIAGSDFDTNSKDVAHVKRVPFGVVLAISPFNYPINLAISKIMPALITGNTIIFKPATVGTLAGIELLKIFDEAGFPKGVINSAIGRGREIGDPLIAHDGIDYIHFTGSTPVGRQITQLAGFKGINLELGGKDSALVLADADLDNAAKEIVQGAYNYSGQRCTGIKRVFVNQANAAQLIEKLKVEISKLKVGMPEDNADVTPVIDKYTADKIEALYNDAIDKGAEAVLPLENNNQLIKPVLLTNVTAEMDVAWEEPFGPILPIMILETVEEMIAMNNQSEYGLQASIFTSDEAKGMEIASKLQVGTVHINKKTQRGPDNFPFLGIKNSGIGVQGISESIRSMTRQFITVDKK